MSGLPTSLRGVGFQATLRGIEHANRGAISGQPDDPRAEVRETL